MHQPSRLQDHDDHAADWWTNDSGNRRMLKAELDVSHEDEYFKKEYNNSFGLEALASPLDCSDLVPENAFPLNINPQFDLQVLLQVSVIIVTAAVLWKNMLHHKLVNSS